jgi:hypothetical protein
METRLGQVCIPNISTAERRRRLTGGLIMLGLSLVALTALVGGGVDARWRLALFPLLAGAAAGYFQWRDRT